MLATDQFVGVFGFSEPGDNSPETLLRVAKAAGRGGFAVLLIDPTSKRPICPLAARAAKEADEKAQEFMREAGVGAWQNTRHQCGVHHATTDVKLLEQWIKRLTKSGAIYNLACVPGLSRMVAVDTDTTEERLGFLRDRTEAEGVDHMGDGVTVRSPGQRDAKGEMVHKDGGHFWFRLPEGVDLSTAPISAVTAESGWVVKFGPSSYMLTPPSVRAEGPYLLLGDTEPVPGWLLEKILAAIEDTAMRRERQTAALADKADCEIPDWEARTEWPSLLEPDGWTYAGRPDSCGPECGIWTKPEGGASPKSVTAHEAVSCGLGHGALHFWTTNMPEILNLADPVRRLSKLQYVAHRHHGGDVRAAMQAEGITRLGAGVTAEVGTWVEAEEEPDEPIVAPIRPSDPDAGLHRQMAEAGVVEPTLFDVPLEEPPADEYGDYPEDAAVVIPRPDEGWPVDPNTGLPEGKMSFDGENEEFDLLPPGLRGMTRANPLGTSKAKPVLGDDAKHGLAWDITMALDPGTEADPNAVLFLLLAATGNYLGRGVYALGDHKQNPGRVWPLVIGDTQAGKKGTALHAMEEFICRVDRDYWDTAYVTGLSTAEGLISMVVEPPPAEATDENEDGFDAGVAPFDKRKLVVEEEFGTLLGRSRREGNVLSGEIRKAYDGVQMAVRTRKDPLVAEGHHITIIGAITPEELLHQLTAVDTANGFGNRFLPVYSFRSKSLPLPMPYDQDALRECLSRFDRMARRAATLTAPVAFTEKGAKVWVDFYNGMNMRNMPNGVITSLVNRWAPNTLRLALLYAVMDGQAEMDEQHVKAAIACWEYVEQTIRFVFNDEEVDEDLQRVIEFINSSAVGARTRNEVYDSVFGKKKGAVFLDRLRDKLVGTGRYEVSRKSQIDEKTGKAKGGRPTEFWQRRKPTKAPAA